MAKKNKPVNSLRRNVHACHPIMRKGGVHEKSKSAKRSAEKRATQKAVIDHLKNGDSRFSLWAF